MDSIHILNPFFIYSHICALICGWDGCVRRPNIPSSRWDTGSGRKWWHVCHIYTLFKHICTYLHFLISHLSSTWCGIWSNNYMIELHVCVLALQPGRQGRPFCLQDVKENLVHYTKEAYGGAVEFVSNKLNRRAKCPTTASEHKTKEEKKLTDWRNKYTEF